MRFVGHLPDNLPIYLTAPQLANLLGVSPGTLRNYVKKNVLPPPVHLTPRIHLYQTREVRQWIKRWAPEALREDVGEGNREVESQPEPEPKPYPDAV